MTLPNNFVMAGGGSGGHVFPALAVMTAVLSFNLLGDAWRDWLDPRTRSQISAQEFSR